MANRHLSRSIVLQTLFERDFNNFDNVELLSKILARNMEEFAPGMEDCLFAQKMLGGILENIDKLDKIISKAAPDWPIDQIAIVDRNVLRMGLYELIFGNRKEIPPKVAINESIELAKSFGGDSSGRFVNGVLGTVYRELIPGDEREKQEKMIEEQLAGAIVYRKEDDDFMFALVHDVFGYWTLSKGKILPDEKDINIGAVKKIKEEIGVDIKIEKELGNNFYIASDPERGKIKKSVTYFLASTNDKEMKLKETGGLDNARWFLMEELVELKMYDDIRSIFAKAIKILTVKK